MSYINIDWQRLALGLRSAGSLQSHSLKLGKNKGWLAHISRGEIEEPKFSDGLMLLDYYNDLFPGKARLLLGK